MAGRAPLRCACSVVGICGGGMGDGALHDWSGQVTGPGYLHMRPASSVLARSRKTRRAHPHRDQWNVGGEMAWGGARANGRLGPACLG